MVSVPASDWDGPGSSPDEVTKKLGFQCVKIISEISGFECENKAKAGGSDIYDMNHFNFKLRFDII